MGTLVKAPGTQAQKWRRLLSVYRKGAASQIERANHYVAEFPDSYMGWVVLANGLAAVARYREAKAALKRADRVVGVGRRWYLALKWGELYREMSNLREAEKWYRKALALRPSTTTHIYLGGVLARQGRFAEALRHHRRAIALAKDPAQDAPDEAHYNIGLILRAQGRYRESALHLRKAIKIDPKYALAKEDLRDVEEATRIRRAG